MACKAGLREEMDRAKAFYQQQRELDRTDPGRLHWKTLVSRVNDEKSGFESLSDAEKKYFAAHVLVAEVYNGGFDQFFHNHSGEYYAVVSSMLLELGAQHSLRLLREAKEILFGASDVPLDTESRREYLAMHPAANAVRLEFLDKEFWTDPDVLDEKLAAFAAAHGLYEAAT